jgi:hypothetical protein
MLVNYHPPNQIQNQQQHQNNSPNPTTTGNFPNIPSDIGAHAFAQAARSSASVSLSPTAKVAGNDGATHDTVTSFICNRVAHYANHCPSAISLDQVAYILTQSTPDDGYNAIPEDWIFLDIQSIISSFRSNHMISNIGDRPQAVCACTNGGNQISTLIGDVKNLGTVC